MLPVTITSLSLLCEDIQFEEVVPQENTFRMEIYSMKYYMQKRRLNLNYFPNMF